MHIKQEEYTFEYVKEKMISYFVMEEFYFKLPLLSFSEFELLFHLLFS